MNFLFNLENLGYYDEFLIILNKRKFYKKEIK